MKDDRLTRNRANEEEKINPYQKLMLNNVYRDDIKTVQMEYWSILSDLIKYVWHDEESKTIHDLNVKTLDYKHHKKICDKLKGKETDTGDGFWWQFRCVKNKLLRYVWMSSGRCSVFNQVWWVFRVEHDIFG